MPFVPVETKNSDSFATFGEGTSAAASLRYDLPLPGSHYLNSVTPLEIAADWFQEDALTRGAPIDRLGLVQVDTNRQVTAINVERMAGFLEQQLPSSARPSLRSAATHGVDVANRGPVMSALASNIKAGAGQINLMDLLPALSPVFGAIPMIVWERLLGYDRAAQAPEDVEMQTRRRAEYLKAVATRQAATISDAGAAGEARLTLPVPGLGNSIWRCPWQIHTALVAQPRIALVETWQISSYLGDYGLGKTVRTFSLLPGEQTTITLETWQTDISSQQDSSSIFDSSDTASQERYTHQVGDQVGHSEDTQGAFAMSVGGQLGVSVAYEIMTLGASMETGNSTSVTQGRQDFTSHLDQTTHQHADISNAARRTTVGTISKEQREAGTVGSTVRQISNTNLRRVLNFVFRELNQKYEVVSSRRSAHLVFFNGLPGSKESMSLSGLRTFIEKYIKEPHREEAARAILAMLVLCVDDTGTPRTALQVGHPSNGVFEYQPAKLDANGDLDFNGSVLDARLSWRMDPNPVGQDDDLHAVPGVVTGRTEVTMRTDSVVVEALLGVADALDPYATGLQQLDLDSREADNQARKADEEWRTTDRQRIADALAIIAELPEAERAKAWTDMLADRPEIQVVPVASANGATPRR